MGPTNGTATTVKLGSTYVNPVWLTTKIDASSKFAADPIGKAYSIPVVTYLLKFPYTYFPVPYPDVPSAVVLVISNLNAPVVIFPAVKESVFAIVWLVVNVTPAALLMLSASKVVADVPPMF